MTGAGEQKCFARRPLLWCLMREIDTASAGIFLANSLRQNSDLPGSADLGNTYTPFPHPAPKLALNYVIGRYEWNPVYQEGVSVSDPESQLLGSSETSGRSSETIHFIFSWIRSG